MAKFSDVLTIVNGKNQAKVENPNGKYPIYGSGGVMGFADDYLCDAETVSVGRKGSINKPIFVEEPFWNVDTAFGLVADREKLIPKFLFYFCIHFDFEKLNTTVTIPSLTKSNLLDVEMDLPELSEQKRVVDNLSKMDELIALRKQQLAKLDELAKARFVELFGDSNYPLEPLDNNVIEMFIGPFGSSLKNEVFVDEKEGFCMVYEQKHAIQKTMNVPTRYVPKSKYEELKRFTILGGDIIVSCRGTIGEILIVPDNAPMGIMHPSIMKVRLNTEKYNQKFFVFALEQYMEEHNAEAKGSGVKMAVSATVLGQSDFVVPPMEVQNQFAAFVEQTDKSKLAIQQSLDKLETLKKALMQKYFG